MALLNKELIFLLLQFLDEEKFEQTVHKLEKESGVFFNMDYFEKIALNGEWDTVESYLSGFTSVSANRFSVKTFFEIRKQKYLEALDRKEAAEALEILIHDLKTLPEVSVKLFNEMTQLLSLENIRENERLSNYGDTKSARQIMVATIKRVIKANPLFRDKLVFPEFQKHRLRVLINQSLNCQYCKNPMQNPCIDTLLVDHSCTQPNSAHAPSRVANAFVGTLLKAKSLTELASHGPSHAPPAYLSASLAGLLSNYPGISHPAISFGPIPLWAPSSSGQPRVLLQDDSFDDLPTTVAVNLNVGSFVSTMDFRPGTLTLLVGTCHGEVSVWDVSSREKLSSRKFGVLGWIPCSRAEKLSIEKGPIAVKRVMWSPDGAFFAIAYSMRIVQTYDYNHRGNIIPRLEIDAHVGAVNDLAFSRTRNRLCIITCGADKAIKVWDAINSSNLYTFQGHQEAVYSVCAHPEGIGFIWSTSVDGKIKAWLDEKRGSGALNFEAPGRLHVTMAYSADGTRLFSCETNIDGWPCIMEWNEGNGAIKRVYQGFKKRTQGVVQFDQTKNRFLAAGDDFQVKFWEVDNAKLLMATNAGGRLSICPRVRFSKDGMFLAVSTIDQGIKVLANAEGLRLLGATKIDPSIGAPGTTSNIHMKPLQIGHLSNINLSLGRNIIDAGQSVPLPVIDVVDGGVGVLETQESEGSSVAAPPPETRGPSGVTSHEDANSVTDRFFT